MGKTADGAIWLDADRTTPYEFYQFWINVDDRDVKRFLRFYTLLPLEDLTQFDAMEGAELREAKRVLAFEATALTHGEAAARAAEQAAQAMFGGDGDAAAMPQTVVAQNRLDTGVLAVDLLVETGLAASKGAARRLIQQGGASLNGMRLDTIDATVTRTDVQDGAVILRAGKKRYHRVVVD
jgi:tyrosyl-tRNA synthetase